ncbi:hypothetical protein DRE_00899 [Drechslerella stenobrocha 248]|uniref:Uncharacterized protein n=1 Tax=Drechslerella stenobrocha 248 TaxID=1043628 RepID=W7I788_9PEZI|nr:hypothetical protein DRE_00899 [Drechslerella stenobrocha 248]
MAFSGKYECPVAKDTLTKLGLANLLEIVFAILSNVPLFKRIFRRWRLKRKRQKQQENHQRAALDSLPKDSNAKLSGGGVIEVLPSIEREVSIPRPE